MRSHKNSIKALHGRGTMHQWWKNILHHFFKDEFGKLQNVGVKTNTDFLRQTAISLVRDGENFPVSDYAVARSSRKEISKAISLDYVYDFCHRYSITACTKNREQVFRPWRSSEQEQVSIIMPLGHINATIRKRLGWMHDWKLLWKTCSSCYG